VTFGQAYHAGIADAEQASKIWDMGLTCPECIKVTEHARRFEPDANRQLCPEHLEMMRKVT